MPDDSYATHDVLNQAGDLADYNAFADDAALAGAAAALGAGDADGRLTACGALIGSRRVQALASAANCHGPELRTHDRYGNRIDEVEFHPAWHELMGLIRGSEVHSLAWREPRPGAHFDRAVLSYLWNQGENGVCCPASMTFAATAALRHDPALLGHYQERILASAYDPRPLPPAAKPALVVAMAMTEKQGGSDLRQTQSIARPEGAARGPGAVYRLTGHKWFFSVPVADLFLTLACTEKGVSCFLAEGWLAEGGRNHLLLQRLKEKCGNRSNASAEVEFRGLRAVMLGEEGRGIATILEMAHLTRLECALSSAAIARQAAAQAAHHAAHRRAFQRVLVDQPMMQGVLADLALESEALTWLALRVAAALDAGEAGDEGARALSRIGVPVAKYWACKRAPGLVAEALECHGGNGFIEDHPLARLHRESPLNGVWEGAGNVICLDVMRALSREPACRDAVLAELGTVRGADHRLDSMAARLAEALARPALPEGEARRWVETMALALTASALLRHAPTAIAEAYCRARLGGEGGLAYGTLPAGTDTGAIIDRLVARR